MLNRLFGDKTHESLYVLGLSGIACGLAWSKVVISISLMFLGLNFLLEGEYKEKIRAISSHKLFPAITIYYFLHVVGLIWTDNFGYGLHDIKAKIPLIVLPLILAARPVKTRNSLNIILGVFIGTFLITSIWNYGSYQQWFGTRTYDDIRGLSLFGSHIRYGIMISLATGFSAYFISQYKKYTLIFILLIIWFSYYTFYSQVIAGVLALASIVFFASIYWLWRWKKWLAVAFTISTVTVGVLSLIWLFKPLTDSPDNYKNLPKTTAKGNPYTHHGGFISSETGQPILLFLCEEELREEWNKRSNYDYDSLDIKGNKLKHTLTRYLSSLKFRKDAEGMAKLSSEDVNNIENGIPTVNHKGIMARLHGIRFELNNGANANGHSLLQRMEYWKGGLFIIENNLFFGVGTGDVQDEFNSYYDKTRSILTPENRNRAHNQYLTSWITFGFSGVVIFLWVLISFLQFNWKNNQLIGVLFLAVAASSFLTEDTLETQIGITFFAFFYALFQSKIPELKN